MHYFLASTMLWTPPVKKRSRFASNKDFQKSRGNENWIKKAQPRKKS